MNCRFRPGMLYMPGRYILSANCEAAIDKRLPGLLAAILSGCLHIIGITTGRQTVEDQIVVDCVTQIDRCIVWVIVGILNDIAITVVNGTIKLCNLTAVCGDNAPDAKIGTKPLGRGGVLFTDAQGRRLIGGRVSAASTIEVAVFVNTPNLLDVRQNLILIGINVLGIRIIAGYDF